MKKENGVTLGILVITIVVMLTLAGVLISGTIGGNGVFKQAMNTTNRVDEYKENKGQQYNTLINGLN